jgi:hypothetical protein
MRLSIWQKLETTSTYHQLVEYKQYLLKQKVNTRSPLNPNLSTLPLFPSVHPSHHKSSLLLPYPQVSSLPFNPPNPPQISPSPLNFNTPPTPYTTQSYPDKHYCYHYTPQPHSHSAQAYSSSPPYSNNKHAPD